MVARQLRTQLDTIVTKRPTVHMKAKSAFYVEPIIAPEIESTRGQATENSGILVQRLRDVEDNVVVYTIED